MLRFRIMGMRNRASLAAESRFLRGMQVAQPLLMPWDETTMIEGGNSFPATSWSLVEEARTAGGRLGDLMALYWRPVYAWIRRQWHASSEDAKDLTQSFLERLLSGRDLCRVSPAAGTFRSYLKTALRHFLIDRRRGTHARKRGGGMTRIPLDPDGLIQEAEEGFDREWIASCFSESVRRLEGALKVEGKENYFRVFHAYYVEGGGAPTYASMAERFGVRDHDIGNYLRYARNKLRAILRDLLREQAASDEDALREYRYLVGEEG